MILLWRPKMPDDAFTAWSHAWKVFAEKHGEPVMAADWDATKLARAWDLINRTNGRYVIWARPEFIPNVSMFAELDYLLNEGIRLVVQRQYNCAFAPGYEEPVLWQPKGVDPSLLVFQLTGQSEFTLPVATSVDIWEWLGEERKETYVVPQRFSGTHGRRLWASRSLLGETIYSPFAPPKAGLPFTKDRQFAAWQEQMRAWQIWLASPFCA